MRITRRACGLGCEQPIDHAIQAIEALDCFDGF